MKTKREEIFLNIIKELIKEKNKYEYRYKHPLPPEWIYGEDHPRIGEILAIFPDIMSYPINNH